MTPEVKLLGYTTPAWVYDAEIGGFDVPATDGIDEPLDLIEYAGRWDYGAKSLAKMGDRDIIRRWVAMGHESMLEMVDAQFLVTCSRVVTHELVRHRIASFQQESQRYVEYQDEDPDDLFFVPEGLDGSQEMLVREAYYEAQKAYQRLRSLGVQKQLARYVLPNGTRTRIVVKANLREWRHILKLRMHSSAQPEMQTIANLIHDQLLELFPEVFADIRPALEAGERAAR